MVTRVRLCSAVLLMASLSLFALSGCGGPNKEEVAKQDEQGKQTNDAAMKRMMGEQGMPAPAPGTTPGTAAAPGTMPAPGTTPAPAPGSTPGEAGK